MKDIAAIHKRDSTCETPVCAWLPAPLGTTSNMMLAVFEAATDRTFPTLCGDVPAASLQANWTPSSLEPTLEPDATSVENADSH